MFYNFYNLIFKKLILSLTSGWNSKYWGSQNTLEVENIWGKKGKYAKKESARMRHLKQEDTTTQ